MHCTGKQCTLIWYVDDTKISHEDPKVVSQVVDMIETCFGKLTVKRGTSNNFLGMDINFNSNGTATIKTKEYLTGAIAVLGGVHHVAATPAKKI
jgi:hypothetical protein